MTVEQMIARLRHARDEAIPLLTHEYDWLIGALTMVLQMRDGKMPAETGNDR